MSHKKKAQVQKSLQERRRLYTQELRKATKTTLAVLHELGNIETNSNLFSDISLSKRTHHSLKKLVEKASEAIERIEQDTYGVCLRCGEKIPADRLKFVPFTEYCAQCKTEMEEEDTVSINGSRQRISRMIQNNITP